MCFRISFFWRCGPHSLRIKYKLLRTCTHTQHCKFCANEDCKEARRLVLPVPEIFGHNLSIYSILESRYHPLFMGSTSKCVPYTLTSKRERSHLNHTSKATRQTPAHILTSIFPRYYIRCLFVEDYCTMPTSNCFLFSNADALLMGKYQKSALFLAQSASSLLKVLDKKLGNLARVR